MNEDEAERRRDQVDRVGGKVIARLAGVVLLVGVLAVPVPIIVVASFRRQWTAVIIAVAFAVVMLAVVRWLFSARRRLSDMGD